MTQPFHILIVDDIPLMRMMFTKYVQAAGRNILEPVLGPVDIIVHEAGDGLEAERVLASGDIQLVFLDLMMPRKDGLAVLKDLRQDRRHDELSVVVCSAIGEREVVDKALEVGAQAYIVKPFTLDSVAAKLAEIYTPELET